MSTFGQIQDLQESSFTPPEAILDTSTPNTPQSSTPPIVPLEYQYLSLGASHLSPEPSEGSEGTVVEDTSTISQSSSAMQAEILEIIQRVQRGIDLDQITFNNLMYQQLHQIDQIHHQENPHLYQSSDISDEQINPTFPLELLQDEKEEGEEGETIITCTESPLPIQDPC